MSSASTSSSSYLSPKLEPRTVFGNQHGLFAIEAIEKGELLVVWGGKIYHTDAFNLLTPREQERSIQVEEGMYLIADDEEPADYFNHSCDPNSGLNGPISLVALRRIEPGEHVCFDYAMSDGTPYDEFECQCGSPICRHSITGDDWQNPVLQERYRGYFSPYLQRRIDRMHETVMANGTVKANGNGRARLLKAR